jgi:acyl-CoA thioester hydrolase
MTSGREIPGQPPQAASRPTSGSGPKRPDHAITLTFRAGLHQCDPLAVVWHGRYFEWLEQARTELFRSVDLAVPAMMALGCKMFVVDASCRYMAPILYDQHVAVTAWFRQASPLLKVAYDVRNLDVNRWSARAVTVLATTDVEGNLHSTTPDGILARLPVS